MHDIKSGKNPKTGAALEWKKPGGSRGASGAGNGRRLSQVMAKLMAQQQCHPLHQVMAKLMAQQQCHPLHQVLAKLMAQQQFHPSHMGSPVQAHRPHLQ